MKKNEPQQNGATEGSGEEQAALHTRERVADFSAAMPPTPSAKRMRIAGTIIALIVIGALALGFLPRWHQRQTAMADMNQLAVPTVSVVSPAPGKPESGLVLPAEIKPWREASIFARAHGYLQDWVAGNRGHVQSDQFAAEIETPGFGQQIRQGQ